MRIIRQKGKAQAEKQYKNYVYCFTIEHINFVFDMRMMFIDIYTTPFNLSIICYALLHGCPIYHTDVSVQLYARCRHESLTLRVFQPPLSPKPSSTGISVGAKRFSDKLSPILETFLFFYKSFHYGRDIRQGY